MNYYIAQDRFGNYDLVHHGINGQKWGVRRYQNEDGSWTEAGRKRYGENGARGLNRLDRDIAKAKYQKAKSNGQKRTSKILKDLERSGYTMKHFKSFLPAAIWTLITVLKRKKDM